MSRAISKELEQWGPIDSKILYHSFFILPWAGKLNSYDIFWPGTFGILDHDRLTYRWDKVAVERHGLQIIKRWLLPAQIRRQVWKVYMKAKKELNQFQSESVKELYDKFIQFWNIALIPETANYSAPVFLRNQIRKFVPKNNLDEVLEALLALDRPSFHQESDLELFKAGLRARNKKSLTTLLEKHSQNWGWIENSYYETRRLTRNDFYQRLKGLNKKRLKFEIQKIENYIKSVKKRKADIIKKFKLPKSVINQAEILSFSIWWQDDRKAEVWRTLYKIDNLLRLTSRKYRISLNDLQYYTAEEWVDLDTTGKKLSNDEINQRKKLCVISMKNKEYKILTGRAAAKIAKKYQTRNNVNQGSVTGITVSRGPLVIGRARIMLSARNPEKMKAGEVLITTMTEPDYIVLMRKAKAIVTDVGGLMSHAAVVSRELGVPCIVGTKIATTIFKNGDRIEVDTSKGMVRKIK